MAKRMKQEFNNNALVAVKQTLTIAPMIDIKKNDIQMQSYENRKDVFSIKGKQLETNSCYELPL